MNRFFLLPLLAFALAACQPTATETVEVTETTTRTVADTDDDRASIEAMTAEYTRAAQAADAAAISALHADDAALYPPNEPAVRGRAAVDAYLATANAEPVEYAFVTEDVVVSASGDLAYEVGSWDDGGRTSKYLTVYRRTPEGWKIAADTWSADAPPPAAD